jgi:homoserine kinase
MSKVRVDVPASTTNLGPGFDVLGMALKLYDTVEIELCGSGLSFEIQGEGADSLSRDETNLVYRAAKRVFDRIGEKPPPMSILLINRIPLARGLGSSGAAAIGGLMAANALARADLTKREILDMAVEMDGHPDNVSASLLGGIVIASHNNNSTACMKFLPSKPLEVVVVVPDFQLLTSHARSVLPKSVDIQTAVFNISRTAILVASLATGDCSLLGIAMDDKLHQPYREKLVPGLKDVFQAVKSVDENAAVALSGAGSSVVVLCTQRGAEIGEKMQQAFLVHNISSRVMLLDIDEEGAKFA